MALSTTNDSDRPQTDYQRILWRDEDQHYFIGYALQWGKPDGDGLIYTPTTKFLNPLIASGPQSRRAHRPMPICYLSNDSSLIGDQPIGYAQIAMRDQRGLLIIGHLNPDLPKLWHAFFTQLISEGRLCLYPAELEHTLEVDGHRVQSTALTTLMVTLIRETDNATA